MDFITPTLTAISVIAAFFSVAAATRSAEQTRRSNALNLVPRKIELYDRFCDVYRDHTAARESIDISAINRLCPLVEQASLIHNESIYRQISEYHVALRELNTRYGEFGAPEASSWDDVIEYCDQVLANGTKLKENLKADIQKATRDVWRPS